MQKNWGKKIAVAIIVPILWAFILSTEVVNAVSSLGFSRSEKVENNRQLSRLIQLKSIYFFGDSLSDSGAVLGQKMTTLNGPVWAEIISEYFGISPNSAFSFTNPGHNFAVSGENLSDVKRRFETFIADKEGRLDPNDLYVFWAGGNDLLQTLRAVNLQPQNAESILTSNLDLIMRKYTMQVENFLEKGANHLLLLTIPDVSSSLANEFLTDSEIRVASYLLSRLNAHIRYIARKYSQTHNIYFADAQLLQEEIILDPLAYGFKEVETFACSRGIFICSNPEDLREPGADQTYLKADILHPTSAVHKILADMIIDNLESSILIGVIPRTLSSRLRAQYQENWGSLFQERDYHTLSARLFFDAESTGNPRSVWGLTNIRGLSVTIPLYAKWAATLIYQAGLDKIKLSNLLSEHRFLGMEVMYNNPAWQNFESVIGGGLLSEHTNRSIFINERVMRYHKADSWAWEAHAMGSFRYENIWDSRNRWDITGRLTGQYLHFSPLIEREAWLTSMRIQFPIYYYLGFLIGVGYYHTFFEKDWEIFTRLTQETFNIYSEPAQLSAKWGPGSFNIPALFPRESAWPTLEVGLRKKTFSSQWGISWQYQKTLDDWSLKNHLHFSF